MSDRGGRRGNPGREPPQRRGGSRRDPGDHREEELIDEPPAGGRGASYGRGIRDPGWGGVRRRGGRSRSGTGLYGSQIGDNVARAGVAELVGTAILVYAGTTVAVAASLAVQAIGTPVSSLAVPLVFGLTLTALVASLGHVSGAHLNPAVTLGLAAIRRFPWDHVPIYLAAQLLGAILGSIATWITLGAGARSEAALASPGLTRNVGFLQGFFVEAAITFILVFVVISVATDDRVANTVAPVAVGFALAVAVFVGGPATG